MICNLDEYRRFHFLRRNASHTLRLPLMHRWLESGHRKRKMHRLSALNHGMEDVMRMILMERLKNGNGEMNWIRKKYLKDFMRLPVKHNTESEKSLLHVGNMLCYNDLC